MKKITEQQLKYYVAECGEFEKEHRKYSTFYCWSSLTISQEDVDALKLDDQDASELIGVRVLLSGLWDDSHGSEWDSVEYYKDEEYQELVPEHYVTKYKSTPVSPF